MSILYFATIFLMSIYSGLAIVVRFGNKYRQWNAAFDAGYASALGKPVITLYDEELIHALKEVNAAATASARTPEQVVAILKYSLTSAL